MDAARHVATKAGGRILKFFIATRHATSLLKQGAEASNSLSWCGALLRNEVLW